jgi:hypothetical protein
MGNFPTPCGNGDIEQPLNLNVVIFWDISQCSPYVNRRFIGTCHLHLQGLKSTEKRPECSKLLVPSSADFRP